MSVKSILTIEQMDAFNTFVNFLNSSERQFLLSGSGGTGKSFLTRHMIDYVYRIGLNLCVLAPTHKALNVIKTGGNSNVEYSTIAKFLYKKQNYKSNGDVEYKRDNDKYLKHNYNVVFIDESSMVESDDYNCFCNMDSTKFVFIGDGSQLPPVGEKSSIVFDNIPNRYNLTKTVRTKDKNLYDIYTKFRDIINADDDSMELNSSWFDEDNQGAVFTTVKDDFYKYIKKYYVNDGSCKIIAYRNIMVHRYNTFIRNIIYSDKSSKYVPGEQLIFSNNYTHNDIEYYNNDEIVVDKVEKCTLTHPYNGLQYIVYKLVLTDGNTLIHVAEESLQEYNDFFSSEFSKLKQSNASSKKWTKYYQSKHCFQPPINYAYALTTYKSQGSTIETTFIDLDDIFLCLNTDEYIMKKAMYTAITRASHKLYALI